MFCQPLLLATFQIPSTALANTLLTHNYPSLHT